MTIGGYKCFLWLANEKVCSWPAGIPGKNECCCFPCQRRKLLTANKNEKEQLCTCEERKFYNMSAPCYSLKNLTTKKNFSSIFILLAGLVVFQP
jgi:hypothetical protein